MFKKVTENFICDICGTAVKGNGYTNHCPKCLWSKHVDVDPGDRASVCGGMMKPIGAEENGGEWSVLQRCEKCGFERKNKIANGDNFDEVVRLSTKFI